MYGGGVVHDFRVEVSEAAGLGGFGGLRATAL